MANNSFPVDEQLSTTDPWLEPHHGSLQRRLKHTIDYARRLFEYGDIVEFAAGHHYFGLHISNDNWVLREWAPAATKVYLIGEFSDWRDNEAYAFSQKENGGTWELYLPRDTLAHGSHYKLRMHWSGGEGERVPAWATYVVQDSTTKLYDAVIWHPKQLYEWHDSDFHPISEPPLIYEAHVGMSGEDAVINTYRNFANDVIPRIKAGGYNTVQLMAIAEHPYYGSFGYHVSSFFAPSSRFGTPDDLRYLIDTAHQAGLRVVMDLVHSHAVKNEIEGISRYDGTLNQFFHEGNRGNHEHWDSRVFDYGKPEVAHFLLSNCRYWIDEFHIDGFRFDGVTSMVYLHHGIGRAFKNYDDYFQYTDDDAIAYLTLANQLIHELNPEALTIAEEMSGMPGLAAPLAIGGVGFDYRLSMGVPDLWIKYTKDLKDEEWSVSQLYNELVQHRPEESTINYAESHDQALVGDKTLMFRLSDKEMYDHMSIGDDNIVIDRAMALHKMIRLITAGSNHGGYLNFMGNEFGHPEWIDFPREGNGWSYYYARRQWSLREDMKLKYHYLAEFDRMIVKITSLLRDDPEYVVTNDGDHVISFMRGDFLFVFNFHPEKSYNNYGISVPDGNYEIVISSDNKVFGGFGRVDTSIAYPAGSDGRVRVYLPARTAVVLRRMLQ